MDEQKQELINQQQAGDALREMQNHQGWGELVKILSTMYSDGVESLIKTESVEIRMRLQAIDDIASQIKLKIDFGKAAAEELKSSKFQALQATP